MADYFTSDHFKLLNRWKGQKRDDSNPEQNRAYEDLKRAYELTELWARGLQRSLFPHGPPVEIRKRPTNQGNNFASYNWAKIYPSSDSPKELAYTVGINADNMFVVKIDTVGLEDREALQMAYEAIRGTFDNNSPIVRTLSAESGLAMSMEQLIAWSEESISGFQLTYEQLCDKLDLKARDATFPHQEPMTFTNNEHNVSLNPPPPIRRGHCMDVWVVCELLRRSLNRVPARAEVASDQRLAKSNQNNVFQEYARWKRWWNEGDQRSMELSNDEILRHFDGKAAFKQFRSSWSPEDVAFFCRLARIVHLSGLDWWHVDIDVQVRFGRAAPGRARAISALGYVTGTTKRVLSLSPRGKEVMRFESGVLSDTVLDRFESILRAKKPQLDDWLSVDAQRRGLWPDQLSSEAPEDNVAFNRVADTPSAAARMPMNRIYYGPPGTGKTFELSKLLRSDYEQPLASVSPDAWKRQIVSERVETLTWWEGAAAAIYDLGGSAKVTQLSEHPFIQAIAAAKGRTQNIKQTIWGALQNHTVEASSTVATKVRMAPAVFDKTADSTWEFAGEWKEACADLIDIVEAYRGAPPHAGTVQHYSFVTFHQSFGYEEFVEGLRPVLAGDGEAGEIKYEIRSGAFKDLCRQARSAPGQRFAMVIDEINRGNISKIFGELITLIESDKREGAENALSVRLPYSGEIFSVPQNVDIIGTMNTADRSLALLDTALRRRFDFVAVLPDARDDEGAPLEGLRVTSGDQVINVPRMLSAINQRIEALYDRDHCIGHAYFMSLAKLPDGAERLSALQEVFRTRILPLLEEYFFEDWQKIRLVLADNQKPPTAQFVAESGEQEDDLARLFGDDHKLDSYTTKRRCAVQDAAFSIPDAYIGIYKSLIV